VSEGIVYIIALLAAKYWEISFTPLTENIYKDIFIGAVGALPPFAFFLFTISESADRVSFLRPLRKIVMVDIKTFFLNSRVSDLIMISFAAGFAEELLFRGVLQARFGIVIASIIFGLVHFISPLYVIITTLMGLYIGAFYYFTESLLVPIQMHFIYDLGALLYLKYVVSGNSDKDSLLES
jgi:membrane protease YdiL (CAAX protease family)